MAFFDEQELAALAIERMVFHLVGPKEGDLVRLEAVSPGKFANFFLDRIRSVNAGAPYAFSEHSETRRRLASIDQDLRVFQDESERLAEAFQGQHRGTAAAGAFLVFVLTTGAGRAFALLKYDDETVLTYEMQDAAGGRKRVTLEALERTFVQNKDALQKSALIRLTDGGGDLTVLDRRNQQAVARYFESFLAATRVHEDDALTEKLVEVTRDVIRTNRDLVPPEVYREMTKRTYDAASAGGQLGVDDQKSFLDTVVGRRLADNDPLVAKFNSALKKARIDGAPVTLNVARVRPANTIRYVTTNHIQIRVPRAVERFVEVLPDRIIIHDRVEQQYDDADGAA